MHSKVMTEFSMIKLKFHYKNLKTEQFIDQPNVKLDLPPGGL